MKKKLYDFCVNILAHCQLNYEITLGGNGTNSFEAANVAHALMREFNIIIDSADVRKRARELEKEFG